MKKRLLAIFAVALFLITTGISAFADYSSYSSRSYYGSYVGTVYCNADDDGYYWFTRKLNGETSESRGDLITLEKDKLYVIDSTSLTVSLDIEITVEIPGIDTNLDIYNPHTKVNVLTFKCGPSYTNSFGYVAISSGAMMFSTYGVYASQNGNPYITFSVLNYRQVSADYKIGFSIYEYNFKISETEYNSIYQEGYTAGESSGSGSSGTYDEGYAAGKTAGYNEGYAAGNLDGYATGYAAGYKKGLADAQSSGSGSSGTYDEGYAAGRTAGYNEGYAIGETAGYNEGYAAGETAGYNTGYDVGYTAGYTAGGNENNQAAYDRGLADGQDVTYSLNAFFYSFYDGLTHFFDPVFNIGYGSLTIGSLVGIYGIVMLAYFIVRIIRG